MTSSRIPAMVLMAAAASLAALSIGLLLVKQRESLPGKESRDNQPDDEAATRPMYVAVEDNRGVNFVHRTAATGSYFFPEIVGSGAALFDYDRDGDLDLYLVNLGDAYRPEGTGEFRNQLFEQVESGRFVDKTAESNLGDAGVGMGVAVGDINNDGFDDVYVTNYGDDRLYLNQGDKTFVDMTQACGIDNGGWGTSACFLDFDQDGWLDLYVANYVEYQQRPCTQIAGGGQDYCAPSQFPAAGDRLFRNATGDGLPDRGVDEPSGKPPAIRFQDVSRSSGIDALRGPGLGVTSADFNGDRLPDIYVANDQTPNFLWINQGDGRFRDQAVLVGCATSASGSPQASMGIGLGDVNRDSRSDLFLTHLQGEHHTLYLSDGATFFRDASTPAGLQPSNRYTGFGTGMVDVEHDGDLDLLVVNGAVRRSAAAGNRNTGRLGGAQRDGDFWSSYAEPNAIYLNDGSGRFRPESQAVGDSFQTTWGVSRGMAIGDLDNDGDLDAVVVNTASAARIYRNNSTKRGGWVSVRAVEPRRGGRDAYGAVVTAHSGERSWTAVVQPASSYLSSNDSRVHFGLGNVQRIDRFQVVWNDGTVQQFPGGPVNQPYVLSKKR